MKIKVTYEKIFELEDIYDEDIIQDIKNGDIIVDVEEFCDGIIEFLVDSPGYIVENLEFEEIKE